MNDSDLLLGALGICRKAGGLLHGYDRVCDAVAGGKACLVLLASDASDRTASHIRAFCRDLVECRAMPLTTAQLTGLTPRPAAVFAVTDENLARLCAKHLTQD
ncbi:MAG TPA: ribosomal L7Ae/L30e/S12e/Gadd45 family protein [Candidatus Gemmiger faecigallinarum]|nr:ribosomal L7Ae/L30e/S12e/Gadd45 family protein [Candidatus Gemmiger faecigallinarum]